ncbi:MAG: glycosyltransferase family 2 protein [Blastocatellia bacterium]|nr:glycosyltransferase family 2 protein [Blastocatellia bacterium]
MALSWFILGSLLVLVTLPGTVELLLLTLAGWVPPRRATNQPETTLSQHIAVIVPAHNEENGIARCVTSILHCDAPQGGFSVFVVADNCTDRTAEMAAAAGAQVLVRHNETRRGKGYALDAAFSTLLPRPIDIFLTVDADTEVEPNLLVETERWFAAGADAVQSRYAVNNPADSIRTRLMNVALYGFNILRPRGRSRLGLSCGIFGNGFGLSKATLQAIPYDATSVVEDLEYHLRLVKAGRKVVFLDSTTVRADMPTGGKAVQTQRARWEGGRLRMMVEHTPELVREILSGRFRLLEPCLDLLLLPLAFHLLLLLAAGSVPLLWVRGYAAVGFLVVMFHVLAAIFVGGGGWRDVAALAAAPFYIVWKVTLVGKLLQTAQRNAAWVRTDRAKVGGKS